MRGILSSIMLFISFRKRLASDVSEHYVALKITKINTSASVMNQQSIFLLPNIFTIVRFTLIFYINVVHSVRVSFSEERKL